MPKNKNLDLFLNGIDESGYTINPELKNKVLRKAYRRIRGSGFYFKAIAAACAVIVVLSAFIPNTPVNALCQKLFAFIPGIGVVQNTDYSIRSILEKPVRAVDGEQFVEIKTAYISNNTLNLSMRTNVGAVNIGEFTDPAEFKKFFSGETAPALYLLGAAEKIKAAGVIRSGPSYETRVYSIDAHFILGEDDMESEILRFEIEGFNKVLEIKMSPVAKGMLSENMANSAIIEDIIVFANEERQGDILEVLLSSTAPADYKNIRFYLFDLEQQLFGSGVHFTDKEGNIYLPDDGMRKKNGSGIGQFYFNIPEDKEGLRLVIPQILYSREYFGDDIKLSMNGLDKGKKIDKVLNLPGTEILIEKASNVPANDPILPDEFFEFDCLKIDASAMPGKNSKEQVCRVIPDVEVYAFPDGYVPVSQSVNSELWGSSQRGHSLVVFNDMGRAEKIRLKFDVEYALTGPWEIELKGID